MSIDIAERLGIRLVMAVDPGQTTGFAWYQPGAYGDVVTHGAGELPHMEFLDDTAQTIQQWGQALLVVCESYVITAGTLRKTRGENWSLEQIGVLRWLCHRHGARFELQKPSEAKSFATNEKLHHIGWYVRGQRHANDALRHLLLALVRHELIDIQRLT